MDEVKTNAAGVGLIKFYEGILDGLPDTPGYDPYLCPAGIPTIGYGSIWGMDGARVTMDHRPITMAEADLLLERELGHTEQAVASLVKVPLTINQFSALCSLCYNIGSGNFQTSTFRMKLNRKDYLGCANNFWQWRRGGGRILPGLVARREAEKDLFLL
jgi:lysozyme